VTARALGLAAGLLASAATAVAGPLALADHERAEALRVGERSIRLETFDVEWRVENAAGESVTVLTPFHRLALAARHAAFQQRTLGAADQERVLDEVRDRLVLWVRLRGGHEDFARHYRPRLVVGGGDDVAPAFVQNEHTALPLGDGAYLARCVYAFPTAGLTRRDPIVLAVRDAEGREVSRFTIDLGRMR
jgi:hypothetical protein